MFESALGNLCIVICGMTVLLSAFFIWRTETLPNRRRRPPSGSAAGRSV